MAKLKQEQETSDLSRGSRQACLGAREGEKGSGEADGSTSSHWVKRRPRPLELQLVCLSRIGLYGQSSCCNPTRDQNLGIHSLVSRNTQKPTTTHLIHYSRYQKLRDCIDSQPLKLRRTAIAGDWGEWKALSPNFSLMQICIWRIKVDARVLWDRLMTKPLPKTDELYCSKTNNS